MMTTATRAGLIASMALLALLASSAEGFSAEESTPDKNLQEAKEAFEAAQTAFVREQYGVAAEKFIAAFERKPYPAFLFNAAVSFEKAKQLDRAQSYFEKYLQTDPNASDAAQVKARIDDLTKLLAPPPPPPAPPPAPAGPDGQPAAPPAPGAAAPPAAAPGGAPPAPVPGTAAAPGAPATPPPPPPELPAFDTKGLVVIDSKPQGATIYLNDKRSGPFGRTPWHGSLESKPVRLILESKGFKPEQRAVSPRSDKLVDVYIALSEEHYLGWIELTSNVAGAQVFIDRKDIGPVGRTPFTGHLKPGKHTLFLERLGYKPTEKTIEVKPGTATEHAVAMEKTNTGWVNVTGRGIRGGTLVIDDKVACATPCSAEVSPGKHAVVVAKDGMEDYEGEIDVQRSMETTIDVQFSARPSRTRVISTAVIGLALLGGGVFLGRLSESTKDGLTSDINAGRNVDNQDPRFLRGKIEAIGADVLFGLGAIVTASAVWGLVFSHGPESRGAVDQKAIGLAPTGGPGSAGLQAWGRF